MITSTFPEPGDISHLWETLQIVFSATKIDNQVWTHHYFEFIYWNVILGFVTNTQQNKISSHMSAHLIRIWLLPVCCIHANVPEQELRGTHDSPTQHLPLDERAGM